MIFYLGTHQINWIWKKEDRIPFFISDTRLRQWKKLKPANFIWALDSGGFTELHKYGRWTVKPKDYCERVQRYKAEIGKLQFAAIQDWMCEESARKKTGKSIIYHQAKTIESFLDLNALDPTIPWLPVLQGQTPQDYLNHLAMYREHDINNTYFGIGSVCRRAGSNEIIHLIKQLHKMGIELHGFGVKTLALAKVHKYLKSADSLAWAITASYEPPKYKSCTHKACSSCYNFAKSWYRHNLRKIV